MKEEEKTTTSNYSFRASIPTILRYFGIGGALLALIAVLVGFYVATSKPEFRSGEFPAELSEKVVGVVNGYDRKETEGGVLKYSIRADVAKTFDDNHQELEEVELKVFKNGDSASFDRISSDKAVYIPKGSVNEYQIFFAGNVFITTASDLEIETDQVNYKSPKGLAIAEESVVFRRFNISGRSFGAMVDTENRTLELSRDVEISMFPPGSGNEESNRVESSRLRSGRAFVELDKELINLYDGVFVAVNQNSKRATDQMTELRSLSGTVRLADKEVRKVEMIGEVSIKQPPSKSDSRSFEAKAGRAEAFVDGVVERVNMFDGVTIETTDSQKNPVISKSDSATYERASVKYELKDRVEIVLREVDGTSTARGSHAVYRQNSGEITLTGGAEATQKGGVIRADRMFVELAPDNSLKMAVASGNAYLAQRNDQRLTEVTSVSMRAWYSGES